MLLFSNPLSGSIRGAYGNSVRNLSISGTQLGTGKRYVPGSPAGGGFYAGTSIKFTATQWRSIQRGLQTSSNLAQAGQTYMSQMEDILLRMKELTVDAQDPLLNASDIANISIEFQGLHAQIQDISDGAEFNGTRLADGSLGTSVRLDPFGTTYSITVSTDLDTTGLSLSQTSFANTTQAGAAETDVDNALTALQGAQAKFNTAVSVLNQHLPHVPAQKGYMDTTSAQLLNVDTAEATADFVQKQLIVNVNQAVLAQANQIQQSELSLLSTI